MANQNVLNAPIPFSSTKGGTGQSSYTQGDLLYASATDTLSKLAGGTTGQVLGVTGVAPVTLGWVSNSAFSLANRYNSNSFVAGLTVPGSIDNQNTVFTARDALPVLTSGGSNVLFADAGYSLTTGSQNSIFGLAEGAGRKLVDGGANSIFGTSAGQNLISGNNNTFLGFYAGYNVEGSNNLFAGQRAGQAQAALDNSVVLGENADVSVNSLTNVIVIGQNASCSTSNTAIIGNTSIVGMGIGTTAAAYTLTLGGAGTGSVFMPRSSSQSIAVNGGVYAVSSTDLPYYVNQNATFALASAVTTNYGTANTLLLGNGTNYTPLVKGSNANVLTVNGSGNVVWAAPATAGTVTSVAESSSTGLIISGSPVTSSGTITIDMPGTGTASAVVAGDLLLGGAGSYAGLAIGTTGKVLTSNGTTAAWSDPAAAPGLATFLCQTSANLPANGVDVSAAAATVIIGDTPTAFAALPFNASINPTLGIYNNNTANAGEPICILSDTSTHNTNATHYLVGYTGTVGINMVNISSYSSRGSATVPAGVHSADILYAQDVNGGVDALGNFAYVTSIRSVAEGAFSTGSTPAGIHFWTTNSSGAIREVGKFDKTGLLTASFGISATTLTLTTTPLATGSGGVGQSSYSAGDTLYYASGTTMSKLAIGAANTILASTGTAPAWVGGTAMAGQALTYDGANIVWDSLPGTGTVTSVDISSSTGLISAGGPVTGAGTISVDLPGSGAMSAIVAGDLLLGSTGSYAGLAIGGVDTYLHSNGTTAAWVTPPFAPIVSGGAADTAGAATIAASTTSITVNTTAVHTGSVILVSIGGFTGTASLALGPVGVTTVVDGTSFDISIATVVPVLSTAVVNWMIVKS